MISGPIIKFEPRTYYVNEPIVKGDVNTVQLRVLRTGDISDVSVVNITTKGGMALSGQDFNVVNRGKSTHNFIHSFNNYWLPLFSRVYI